MEAEALLRNREGVEKLGLEAEEDVLATLNPCARDHISARQIKGTLYALD